MRNINYTKSALVIDILSQIIAQRAAHSVNDNSTNHSYTVSLLIAGREHILRKFGEEAIEVILAANKQETKQIVSESADLLYHLLVLWQDAGINPKQVWAELENRKDISGLQEKASRIKHNISRKN